MRVKIYCSGSIIKGKADAKKLCWTDRERNELRDAASPIEIDFLNPDDPMSDLGNTEALFGRDMYQVQIADFVVVDARERRGIGIGIEIMASRVFGTPLLAVAPRGSYYRMGRVEYRGSVVEDYVHPHLASLADAIVGSFAEAGAWIAENDGRALAKPIEHLESCIKRYTDELLPSDAPMKRLLERGG